ncbi:hydroxymethylglutaryl-CoA lyase [Fusarium redolens]|uniref:hydroxymethylglutaryl-CoA lyase n=1 Tax=Fusarium redolens TaxID=48865 RepID=A0A9P9JSP2_FUSRE|nr:hydroxymethylglutaryl-CoA lyase [Fusarium redolens]KAH7205131.1 hydroxymethylglutaryl-CoA lyase [Fusarium redolens]
MRPSIMTVDHGSVRIVEVGPRDGLQNIKTRVPTPIKHELIQRLLACKFKAAELTSFVSPKAIPQLADCRELLTHSQISGLLQDSSLSLPVLVPNLKGFDAAQELGVKEVAVFVSAAEGFSKANIKCTVAQGIQRAVDVARAAKCAGISVRGYVSCIFACPYDGPTPPAAVLRCVTSLIEAGCHEVSLGDTTGVGTPGQTRRLLSLLLDHNIRVTSLAGHFHDTYGQALANAWEAYSCGLRIFDSSVAGLGGCPFAPGARGNLASEDLVYMFEQSSIRTGIDIAQLVETSHWICGTLGISNGSRAGTAYLAKLKLSSTEVPKAFSGSSPSKLWSEVRDLDGLKVLRSGAAVKIILNRPQNGNALTQAMIQGLTSLYKAFGQDPTVSRIVLSAKGKFFCTGMDLSKDRSLVAKGDSATNVQFDLLTGLFQVINNSPKVTVSSINGPCFGGGVGLALSCDIRISTADASMTLSEAKLGLAPATISKYVIREFGIAFSREAMLSARTISAKELKQRGIVAVIAPYVAQLDRVTDGYISRLQLCAPEASAMIKSLVSSGWTEPGSRAQDECIRQIFERMMKPSGEASKGLAAFQASQRNIDWDQLRETQKVKL